MSNNLLYRAIALIYDDGCGVGGEQQHIILHIILLGMFRSHVLLEEQFVVRWNVIAPAKNMARGFESSALTYSLSQHSRTARYSSSDSLLFFTKYELFFILVPVAPVAQRYLATL